MSKKVTAWLAVDANGYWCIAGWKWAENGDSIDGDSAESAFESLDSGAPYRMHKCIIDLPDLPKVQGNDVTVSVGIADKDPVDVRRDLEDFEAQEARDPKAEQVIIDAGQLGKSGAMQRYDQDWKEGLMWRT